MKVNFDTIIERKNTNCSKYDGLVNAFGKDGILPLWVADMDFPVPEEVTQALKKRAEHPIYGYNIIPDGYYESFIRWQENHHNWKAEKDWLCHTPGVLTALSTAILAFTKADDRILIQPPVYFPFCSTIEALGRTVINNQLKYENGCFSIDFDDFEKKAKDAKMFIFCSPHNPSGRVWNKDELTKIESICRKYDLMVFSDEIHSDIVYAPNHHTVFASISDWSREHSIIAMAPSKTFNIAGLETSIIAIPNQEKREKYQHLLRFGLHVANPNSYGIAATKAAYEYGEEWYQELLLYLQGNIDYLDNALKTEALQVRLVRPEATYIPLLDMYDLNMTPEELKNFMIDKVGAALNAGSTFGPGGEGFMRINVATQRKNIVDFVHRLKDAIGNLS